MSEMLIVLNVYMVIGVLTWAILFVTMLEILSPKKGAPSVKTIALSLIASILIGALWPVSHLVTLALAARNEMERNGKA